MTFRTLFENDIYAIPSGDIWSIPEDRLYVVYSPLNGIILLATHHELIKIEDVCAKKSTGNATQVALLRQLFEQRNQFVFTIPKTPDDICEVDILANFKCNFNCSYCYSATGRSSKEVSFEQIKAVVDYLFSSGRQQKRPYKINFSGGGEPLLSFPLIKKTIDYIEEKTKDTHFKYSYGLVTNGSLLTPEIVDCIKSQRINLVVSFEVLQEFQDMERGNYTDVASNIDLLLEKECPFGIRATITPQSVHHLSEMVKELSVRFPRLGAVVFDTVLSADIFKIPQQLSEYYHNFLNEYYVAKELGGKLGVEVACNAIELSSILRKRTCQGKIVLTPDGYISSCARISSPQEKLYDKFVYGKVNGNKVEMDSDKLSGIMTENNIETREECRQCYARWNCGGGCWLFTKSFAKEFEEPFCNFTREALKRNLYQVLSERHYSVRKQSLWNSVNEQIKSGNI